MKGCAPPAFGWWFPANIAGHEAEKVGRRDADVGAPHADIFGRDADRSAGRRGLKSRIYRH